MLESVVILWQYKKLTTIGKKTQLKSNMLMKWIFQIVYIELIRLKNLIKITMTNSYKVFKDYTNSSINHDAFLRKSGKSLTIDYLKKKMDEKDKMKFVSDWNSTRTTKKEEQNNMIKEKKENVTFVQKEWQQKDAVNVTSLFVVMMWKKSVEDVGKVILIENHQ